eukprot:8590642-Pyramimonas_sp.AAC.1
MLSLLANCSSRTASCHAVAHARMGPLLIRLPGSTLSLSSANGVGRRLALPYIENCHARPQLAQLTVRHSDR